MIDKLGFDKQGGSGQMMPNVVRTITNQNRKRPMDNTDVDVSSLPIVRSVIRAICNSEMANLAPF